MIIELPTKSKPNIYDANPPPEKVKPVHGEISHYYVNMTIPSG